MNETENQIQIQKFKVSPHESGKKPSSNINDPPVGNYVALKENR